MKQALMLATTNPKKIERLSHIFNPYFDDIQSQDILLSTKDTSDSIEEVAAIKAVAISRRYNGPAVASEGGDLSEAIAIANNGKLLFAEQVEDQDSEAAWQHLKEMVDWFLRAK